jgi:hypothetical protein
MTVARVITRSVSAVVEQLELDGDVVVTVDRLAAVIDQVGQTGDPRKLAYELQRDGWLGKLRTRHAWEFLPGARGGAYGSGDRFIEFRAQRAVDSEWVGVLAMESAASVLGLAQRISEQEVVALPGDAPFPKALVGDWRYVRTDIPDEGIADVDGLRSWGFEGLLVGIATRPSAYRDIAGLAQWLESSKDAHGDRFNEMRVARLLDDVPASVRQRAAFLLLALGNTDGAAWLLDQFPSVRMTAWFGPHEQGGRFDPLTKVNDTLLAPYLGIGGGA